jgi:hypothetical protein
MSDEDERIQRGQKIRDRGEFVAEIRRALWERGSDGVFDERLKRKLAAAAVSYYEALQIYKGETVVDDDDFPDMRPIRDRMFREKRVRTRCKRAGDGYTYKTVPAVSELNGEYIIDVTEQLDRLAKQLGFEPSARDTTPHDDIGHDDLAALLDNRGQDEALDKIPGDS